MRKIQHNPQSRWNRYRRPTTPTSASTPPLNQHADVTSATAKLWHPCEPPFAPRFSSVPTQPDRFVLQQVAICERSPFSRQARPLKRTVNVLVHRPTAAVSDPLRCVVHPMQALCRQVTQGRRHANGSPCPVDVETPLRSNVEITRSTRRTYSAPLATSLPTRKTARRYYSC